MLVILKNQTQNFPHPPKPLKPPTTPNPSKMDFFRKSTEKKDEPEEDPEVIAKRKQIEREKDLPPESQTPTVSADHFADEPAAILALKKMLAYDGTSSPPRPFQPAPPHAHANNLPTRKVRIPGHRWISLGQLQAACPEYAPPRLHLLRARRAPF